MAEGCARGGGVVTLLDDELSPSSLNWTEGTGLCVWGGSMWVTRFKWWRRSLRLATGTRLWWHAGLLGTPGPHLPLGRHKVGWHVDQELATFRAGVLLADPLWLTAP